MSDKTVSIQAILDGIDYLKNNFIAKLDDQTQQAIDAYTNLNQSLSSTAIDEVVAELKLKVENLQKSYNDIAEKIRVDLSASEEVIAQSSKNILDTLNNG